MKRTRDADGNNKPSASALLERLKKRRAAKSDQTQEQNKEENRYVDASESVSRPTRALAFRDRGHFEKVAQLHRANEQAERINSSLRQYECYLPQAEPPTIEWWDANSERERHAKVYHPIEIAPTFEHLGPEHSKAYLTSEERRRMRRNAHLLKLKESQDRIRLGLDPPPPPKLKVASVAATFGSAYFNDPTRYEQLARDAEHDRREKHEQANQARKEEAQQNRPTKAKMDAKVARDRSLYGTHACVYRFAKLESGKDRYLIDTTAQQLRICGAALWNPSMKVALVIAEGPPPELQKMTKLMQDKLGGTLAWTGEVRQGHFNRWSAHQFQNEDQVLGFLGSRGSDPLWHLVTSHLFT